MHADSCMIIFISLLRGPVHMAIWVRLDICKTIIARLHVPLPKWLWSLEPSP